MKMAHARFSRGFTLIELVIAIAIVGILVAIAVPAYNDSIRKGRRGQAKADLLEQTQLLERHRTVNAVTGYENYDLPFDQSPSTGTAFYAITLAQAVDTYTLTATPDSSTDQANDTCGTLTIDQAGVKTADGPVDRCW